MKVCNKCGVIKRFGEFYVDRTHSDGLSSNCKSCIKHKTKLYYQNNKTECLKRSKKWAQSNKEKSNAIKQKYRENNRDKISDYERRRRVDCQEYFRTWRKKNKKSISEYKILKRTMDINYRVRCNLRSRISNIISGKLRGGSAVDDLGCSINELREHLENMFDRYMSWDNYGEWHIDHIKPLASFDLTDREQFLKACHYTNLQPLWAIDNIKKGAKISGV